MEAVAVIINAIAVGLLLWAAFTDFTNWKIPNSTVLSLIATYGVLVLALLLAGTEDLAARLTGDLAAATALFILGFGFWVFKMMGAGDAKLFFPIGLFVGWSQLMAFGLLLGLFAVLSWLLLKLRIPIQYQIYRPVARLDEIRQTGKVPYGVIMVAAALVCFWLRGGV